MKIDEQDFDELRDLINEALQANYEYDCVSNDNINLSANQMEQRKWINEAEGKMWKKFYDMRAIAKNNILHNSPFVRYTESTTIKENK